ncbi:MAG: S-methyl-5'-thioadenosine phosphorylase [Desulfovibrio sp.]|jgi:5'-methylthioadenosine phosphorylase|nr:S-methyl-5'-thioadenosine phosphorylase [Desulfovibrio sp.]
MRTGAIGIIGGSGLSGSAVFTVREEISTMTPWGAPSDALCVGSVDGVPVIQLSRHGRRHTIPPSQVNFRANLQALKDAGCRCILATTAVGSLRRKIGRGHCVIPDQFIDFTKQRKMTFFERFEPDKARHTPMAEPFDAALRAALYEEASRLGLPRHNGGTVVTIEGPRFSTRAESRMFRLWGGDVINMSTATEATLAGELDLPYAAVAMSTDYDAWNEEEEAVSWAQVLEVFNRNADNVVNILLGAIPRVAALYLFDL